MSIMEYFNSSFKKILGLVLVIAGVIGLFLPILQGVLMISTGVLLLVNKKLIKKLQAFLTAFKKATRRLLKKFKKND